jgi:CHASE2 domain-containing sensor protein
MNASSTLILNAGVNAMVNLFIGFLAFALTNWIPVVIAIVVVVGVIGWIVGKAHGLFGGGRK